MLYIIKMIMLTTYEHKTEIDLVPMVSIDFPKLGTPSFPFPATSLTLAFYFSDNLSRPSFSFLPRRPLQLSLSSFFGSLSGRSHPPSPTISPAIALLPLWRTLWHRPPLFSQPMIGKGHNRIKSTKGQRGVGTHVIQFNKGLFG